MASIEFIKKRIAGKEAELEKLNKKLARIKTAQATNWEKNPYYYDERDLTWTLKDIASAQAALDKYLSDLETAESKAASRNVQVIIDFLDTWKQRVEEYYVSCFDKFLEARAEYYAKDREYTNWFNSAWKLSGEPGYRETYENKRREEKKLRADYEAKWKFLFPYVERNTFNIEKLRKDLTLEAEAKYDDIIERTNKLIGTIIDASNLRVGGKGDLNGYIVGERGKCKVETIGAGGWNIQIYHFRTLIHPMK